MAAAEDPDRTQDAGAPVAAPEPGHDQPTPAGPADAGDATPIDVAEAGPGEPIDGDEATRQFLRQAYDALVAEGFKGTPFQYRKKGQAFGVVKDHGHELQLHVRAFTNGVIESEVELSNRYLEHLVSPRRSSHAEIKAIFEKHGVPTQTINEDFRTRTGAERMRMPTTRTKTSDLIKAGLGVAGAVGAVAVARFVRKGRGGKA